MPRSRAELLDTALSYLTRVSDCDRLGCVAMRYADMAIEALVEAAADADVDPAVSTKIADAAQTVVFAQDRTNPALYDAAAKQVRQLLAAAGDAQ